MRRSTRNQPPAELLRDLFLSLIFLPPLRLAWLLIHNAVNIFISDEWQDDISGLLVQSYRRHITIAELVAQHNESRYLIARIDFLLLGHLFHGDARACMALSYLFACLACLLVYRLARATIADGTVRLFLCLVSSLLIFSPVQTEAWFSGITHTFFFPIVFAMIGMLIACSRLNPPLRFAVAAALCGLAQYSYANGVLTFGMLLPILLLTTKTLRSALFTATAWIALAIAFITVYMHGFGLGADHPDMLLAVYRPLDGLHYFLAFLGSPLGYQPLPIATLLGGIVLGLFIVTCMYILAATYTREAFARAAPWAMIGFYALGSDALCTAGRLGFGVEQALVSRYTVFSIYLTISTLFLGAICLQDLVARRPRFAFPAAATAAIFTVALLILAVRNFTHGATQMAQVHSQRLRAKAAVDWINVFSDDESLQILWPDQAMIRRRARQLNRLGIYEPKLITNPDIGVITVTAPAGNPPGDAVILCGQTAGGRNIAFAMVPVRASRSGWSGMRAANQVPAGTVSISAYAFDAERAVAFRLAVNGWSISPTGAGVGRR